MEHMEQVWKYKEQDHDRGGTVVQWLRLLPHSKKPLGLNLCLTGAFLW